MTSLLLTWILHFFIPIKAAIIVAGGAALSSTAIVMQVLSEQRRQSSQVGRLSLAVLLMQDFAVVPLLVLVSLFANEAHQSVGMLVGSALSKALIALAALFVLGRLMLRPMFEAIYVNQSKNNELFVATTLLIVLSAAWLTQFLGLSPELGAFAAGLLVAETEFHLQAEESINPFKGLCLGLFFMSVGMSFDINLMVNEINKILLLSGALLTIKFAIIFLLCLLFKFNLGSAIHAGLLLAQCSEFAFILFKLSVAKTIIPLEMGQILMIVVTTTMALTPLLSTIGSFAADYFDKKEKMTSEEIAKDIADLEKHVIIIGFGRVGKMIGRVLQAEKICYISTDTNANHVIHERRDGYPVYLGSGDDPEILNPIGLNRARSVIITISEEDKVIKCAKIIRERAPHIPIIVRSRDLVNERNLYKAGASAIVPETYETGLQMAGAVLKSVGVGENEISRIKNQFRLGNYMDAYMEDDDESLLEA
jgi:CPA2 family monovalent cation:H+ antiporter-2